MSTRYKLNSETEIRNIMSNPIQTGYFLEFCRSDNSSTSTNNLNYIFETYHLKDICAEKRIWREGLSYKTIDTSIENFGNVKKTEKELVFSGDRIERNWPSEKVPRTQFIENVKMIWDKYFSKESPQRISISEKTLSNTIHRLQYLHFYRDKVFDEVFDNQIEIFNNEVLPKFLASSHYRDMVKRLENISSLPTADTLKLRLPGKSLCMEWDDQKITEDNLRDITMYNLFHDRLLYNEFLKYSRTIYSEENVLLARAISIFKSIFTHPEYTTRINGTKSSDSDAEDQAWLIFQYFVAPGSAYEVSGLNEKSRKAIMLKLAHPEFEMFSKLESDIHRLIHHQYLTFSYTKQFAELPDKILQDKPTQHRLTASTSSKSLKSGRFAL